MIYVSTFASILYGGKRENDGKREKLETRSKGSTYYKGPHLPISALDEYMCFW